MTPRTRLASTAVILAIALGLAGCADNRVEITAGTGALMQSTVVVAANQAAAGDSAGALATLDSLQAQLRQATATGDISADRAAAIQQAIDLVRADLQPAVAPAPEQTPVPDTTAPDTTAPDTTVEPIIEDVTEDSPNTGNNGNDKESKKEQEKEKKELEKAQKEAEKAQKELEKENEKKE